MVEVEKNILIGFCIYGTEKKYYHGLLENILLIASWRETMPSVRVIVYYSKDAIPHYLDLYKEYSFVTLSMHVWDDFSPMISRIIHIDTLEENTNTYYFSRDADSRVTERDKWCMEEFVRSGKTLHVIRDHYYHGQRIMGGTFGFKKPHDFPELLPLIREWKKKRGDALEYGSDENFLHEYLFPLLQNDCMIHSNIVGYKGETVHPILCEQKDDYDFIGNVYEYDEQDRSYPFFSYKKYITTENVWASWENEQYKIAKGLFPYIDMTKLTKEEQDHLLHVYSESCNRLNEK